MSAEETQTKTQFIGSNGKEWEIPEPYSEGHVLEANEASQLNQVYGENVRNNTRSQIEQMLADGKTDADIQTWLEEYCDNYVFGARRAGGRRIGDPVEREMRVLGIDAIKEACRKKGIAYSKLAKEKVEELLKAYLERNGEVVREKATQRLALAQQVASDTIEGL